MASPEARCAIAATASGKTGAMHSTCMKWMTRRFRTPSPRERGQKERRAPTATARAPVAEGLGHGAPPSCRAPWRGCPRAAPVPDLEQERAGTPRRQHCGRIAVRKKTCVRHQHQHAHRRDLAQRRPCPRGPASGARSGPRHAPGHEPRDARASPRRRERTGGTRGAPRSAHPPRAQHRPSVAPSWTPTPRGARRRPTGLPCEGERGHRAHGPGRRGRRRSRPGCGKGHETKPGPGPASTRTGVGIAVAREPPEICAVITVISGLIPRMKPVQRSVGAASNRDRS
jgi:hypothetical protein